MSVSGFLYKDVLKYILPVGLLFFLFFPMTGIKANEIGNMIPAIIILAFILGILIERISPYPFRIFSDIKHVNATSEWMWENWNLKRVFYNLNSQDRDYLFLTDSYIHFYYNSGLVILVYFVDVLFSIIVDSVCQCQFIVTHSTSFLGNIEINSLLILIFCILIFLILKKLIVREMEYLMCPNGEYEYFGEKLQKEKKILFVNKIYGVVYIKSSNDSAISTVNGVEIELIYHSYSVKTQSNSFGYWAVSIDPNMFGKLITINFPNHASVLGNRIINLGEYDKPYFENIIEN